MNYRFIVALLLNVTLLNCSPIADEKPHVSISSEPKLSHKLWVEHGKVTTELKYNEKGEVIGSQSRGASGQGEFSCANLDFIKSSPDLFYKKENADFLDIEKLKQWFSAKNSANSIDLEVYAKVLNACPRMLKYLKTFKWVNLNPQSLEILEQKVKEIRNS